jgi:hypothetical protein
MWLDVQGLVQCCLQEAFPQEIKGQILKFSPHPKPWHIKPCKLQAQARIQSPRPSSKPQAPSPKPKKKKKENPQKLKTNFREIQQNSSKNQKKSKKLKIAKP